LFDFDFVFSPQDNYFSPHGAQNKATKEAEPERRASQCSGVKLKARFRMAIMD
jgi:hypothetical protein